MIPDPGLGMMGPKRPGVTSGSGLSRSRMEPMNKRTGSELQSRRV